MKTNQTIEILFYLLFIISFHSCDTTGPEKYIGYYSSEYESDGIITSCEINLEAGEPTIEFALDDTRKCYGYFRYDNFNAHTPKIASHNIIKILERKAPNIAIVRCVDDRCPAYDGIWEITFSKNGDEITIKLLEHLSSKNEDDFCDRYGPSEFHMTKQKENNETEVTYGS